MSPLGWGRAIPGSAIQSCLMSAQRRRIRGCLVREHGTLHGDAGRFRRNTSRGPPHRSANDPRHAGAMVPVRRGRWRVHAGVTACRRRMNVPAPGIIPAGRGSLTRTGGDGRTQGPGRHRGSDGRFMPPTGAIRKSNWTQGPAFPPESAAHPLRLRPCRNAGNRAMNLPDARYWAAERPPGGRKGRNASETRGISVYCVALRATRGRPAATRITPDNCRYRERTCQSDFA